MSYDLFFKPRSGQIDEQAFARYFSGRACYQLQGKQACYVNENTGVYFVFELHQESQPGLDAGVRYPVALLINYFRPFIFILEAEPEVTVFVRHFDLLVSDPQMEGMGDGEYDRAGLVSGWTFGNEFACASVLKEENNRRGIFHLPGEQLLQIWRWNFNRPMLQKQTGDAQFVPQIMLMDMNGEAATVAIWPDGLPVVMPPVAYLCIVRAQLAPRKFFRRQKMRSLSAGKACKRFCWRMARRTRMVQSASTTARRQRIWSNIFNPCPRIRVP